ncbi:MAG TPA: class I SAM-dependent methyltransferase [Vicinamibacterales bacterium]|nr:class I SAM-dependent methyltransferase [Vicinamibacterales bacterium]
MSQVESLLCRSAPWRTLATRVVLPWAIGEEQLTGSAIEVGSGSGAMAGALLDRYPGLQLTATDYDPDMVLAAARRLGQYGERAVVAQADASALSFADDTFDLALSFLMLHHVGNWEEALRELTRVVKPGGRVIGCDMVQNGFLDWSERTFGSGDERLISLDEFAREANQLVLRGWQAERGPLFAFRFVLAV